MATKEKKDVKKQDEKKLKVTKKDSKTTKKSATKITTKKESKIKTWFKEVVYEFKKVRWPNKKEMIKYSIATIAFIIFFALFFYIIEIVIYFIKQAV